MKIVKLTYNWRQEGNMQGGIGEDYDWAEVGKLDYSKKEVAYIDEHLPAGEGDKCYYDIYYTDGSALTIFNPNLVYKIES